MAGAVLAPLATADDDALVVRVSWPRRIAYSVSITVVAVVAAWNSYWHIVSVAARGHQEPVLAYSLPASVDGLMLVASLAIAEDKARGRRARGWARFGFWLGALVSVAANMASVVVHYGLDVLSIAVAAWPPVALLVVVEIMAKPGKALVRRTVPAPPPAQMLTPPDLAAADDAPRREVAVEPTENELAPTIGELQPADVAAVVTLIQPAIVAASDLAVHGQPLTRDALSDRLRDAGHAVSNARMSALLKIVRAAAAPGEDAPTENDVSPSARSATPEAPPSRGRADHSAEHGPSRSGQAPGIVAI